MVEYGLWSFAPWLASILLDVSVEDDVVQDPAHVVFVISKNSYNTKPTVILHFSTPGVFWLWPTVDLERSHKKRGLRQVSYDSKGLRQVQ